MEWIKIPNNPETQVVTIACVKDHIEWISVKDRLPRQLSECFVCTEDGSYYFANFNFSSFENMDSPAILEDDEGKKVTHWIYLTDIPKPQI